VLARPLQLVIQKFADSAQGLVSSVHISDTVDESVWHSRPYVELGVDAGSNGAPRSVASRRAAPHIYYMDADWGQPGQVAAHRWRTMAW
jgi:hypothetical protein